MDLTIIFCQVDDFCKQYSELARQNFLPYENIGCVREKTGRNMTTSEVVTVHIYYAMCSEEFKTFKAFYKHAYAQLKSDFRGLLSYGRLIELKQEIMAPMTLFLKSIFVECDKKSFVDSTRIEACKIKREYSHRVLKGVARKGKTTDGWFFGTKLHAIFNEFKEIVYCCFTSGNVADNNNDLMRKFSSKIKGKMFGDKGYIVNKPLWEKLYEDGLQIIHHLKSNMKNILMPLQDKIDLSKRANICEGAFSKLKDRMSLQYTRVRSIYGYVINSLSMVIAYQLWAHERAIPLKAAKLDHSKNDAIAIA
jgi:hypothetical protein